ncbi:hypothetical protein AB3M83_01990 [Microbacterium sp. 179-B 1A2 NHS]|uniref:hypothetical protein n=1 Tax=Microbacterium sp. 179-B 1A2 NHS TaxID=3142383 RepID=UPI00399FFEF4
MELWIAGVGAALVEFWWVAPAAAGAGAAGVLGVRRQRTTRARRLGLTAARLELQQARSENVESRASARLAAAELARVEADRAAGRARPADVAAARRAADAAVHAKNSAAARVRVARAQVGAERAAVPARGTDPRHLPVARAMAVHDEVAARWMQYETDAARRIAFPAMSDARVPATAEFLRLDAEARRLRPESAKAKTTPEQFAAYRAAVHRLQRAFDAAEQETWRLAGHRPDDAPPPPPTIAQRWTVVATEAITRSAEGIAKAAESAASVIDSRRSSRETPPEEPPPPSQPSWPIPSRTERHRRDGRPQ